MKTSCLLLVIIWILLFTPMCIEADQFKGELPANSPIALIENKGQVDANVRYLVYGPQGTAFFSDSGITFDMEYSEYSNDVEGRSTDQVTSLKISRIKKSNSVSKRCAIHMRFLDANDQMEIVPLQQLSGKVNYLKGDQSKWIINVPIYSGVAYREVWPGIDVVFTGQGRLLKYDIQAAAGADLSRIRFKYQGVKKLSLDEEGALHVETPVGTFVEKVPAIYQEDNGKRITRIGHYTLSKGNTVGFEIEDYDPSLPVVIDPVSDLIWGTFLGGIYPDEVAAIALDSSEQVYVVGQTQCSDFPITTGAYDITFNGIYDAFVSKFTADGSTLIYSTYIGGSEKDGANCIDVNPFTGVAYIGGYTYSSDFPIAALHFDNTLDGLMDGFVAALNSTGTGLVYSSYLGGSESDNIYAGALDPSDHFHVAGETSSNDLPVTSSAYDQYFAGESDAFIAKISEYGSVLNMCTYLGGCEEDEIGDIDIGPSGNIYVCGYTESYAGFTATSGAFDESYNGYGDGFIAKLDPTGSSLLYMTFLGEAEQDYTTTLAIDSSGFIYVGGWTESYDFPTTAGAFDTTYNYNYDAFITKLVADGSSLVYSTFIGGISGDDVLDIKFDSSNIVYAVGVTESDNFPVTAGAFQTVHNNDGLYDDRPDAFVLSLNHLGSDLIYCSFLGGEYDDYGYAIALDDANYAYICGNTTSPDFPSTPDSFDPTYNPATGFYYKDAWVMKFVLPDVVPPHGTILINNGDYFTDSTSVTLTITAADNSAGIPQMRISNDNFWWTSWQALTGSVNWTIGSSDGLKTVYIQFKDGVGNVSESITDTIYLDTTAPTGSISINNGALYTNSASVTLNLSALDLGTGVEEMRFSMPGVIWSSWEPYTATKDWTLTSGDGTKTVYVQYKDGAGHISASYNDTILLDTQPPTGSVSINNGAEWVGSTSVTLSLSASDAGSGISLVRMSNDNVVWDPWQTYTTPIAWSLAEGDGVKTVYVKFKDWAGNTSIEYTDTIILDTIPPTGSMIINNGDEYTTSSLVDLTLSAADDGMGVTDMRFANDGEPFGDWESYAATKEWSLLIEEGSQTVSVQFRDGAGRESDVFTDTIVLDSIAPEGSIIINNGDKYTNSINVTLTLNASDSGSGVTDMQFSTDGTTWSGWGTYMPSLPWELRPGDGQKIIYVQYRDAAGLVSDTYSDIITLDTSLPTGSVVIDAGEVYTNSISVTLTLSASDTISSVEKMRFSNDGISWSKWEVYLKYKEWILSSGDETKTVYVQFQDAAGNISVNYSDDIILDSTPPTGNMIIQGDAAYTTTTSVLLTIAADDNISGVLQMRLSNDGTNWTSWQSYSTNKSWTLTSGDGIKTVYIQFNDVAGNESSVFTDQIGLGTPETLPEAKMKPVGQYTIVAGQAVIAKFPDCIYIESPDRICGIKVNGTFNTDVGDAVDVSGTLIIDAGEKTILPAGVSVTGVGTVRALGMTNRNLGGSDWLYDIGTGAGQKGVAGGFGLNNMGLLVRTWGQVVAVDPDPTPAWFMIDDGSGTAVKCIVPDNVTIDPYWGFASVTGISSCEESGDDLYRLLKVRIQGDINAD